MALAGWEVEDDEELVRGYEAFHEFCENHRRRYQELRAVYSEESARFLKYWEPHLLTREHVHRMRRRLDAEMANPKMRVRKLFSSRVKRDCKRAEGSITRMEYSIEDVEIEFRLGQGRLSEFEAELKNTAELLEGLRRVEENYTRAMLERGIGPCVPWLAAIDGHYLSDDEVEVNPDDEVEVNPVCGGCIII